MKIPTFGVLITLLNIGSSVGIVLLNKYLMSMAAIPALFLTLVHYVVQSSIVWASINLGYVGKKTVDQKKAALLSVAVCATIVFQNASLQYASVGFTQFIKMLQIPWTGVMEWFLIGKKLSGQGWASLGVVALGVHISTRSEIAANWLGALCGLGGFLISPIANVYVGDVLRKEKLSPLEYGAYLWVYSAGILFIPGVFAMEMTGIGIGTIGISLFVMLMISSIAGLSINYTASMIIKIASAVSLQVIAALKTLLLLLLSAYFFESDVISIDRAFGLVIAFAGIWWYAHDQIKARQRDQAKQKEDKDGGGEGVDEGVNEGEGNMEDGNGKGVGEGKGDNEGKSKGKGEGIGIDVVSSSSSSSSDEKLLKVNLGAKAQE